MQTRINGKEFEFEPGPSETLIDVLRKRLHLTGTKLVCGSGACGACTVLVNGTPVNSCILPAYSVRNKSVLTIEAYPPERLHPVQRAFMAHDAMQCGYCTPGFVNQAIHFYEKWTKINPGREPERKVVDREMCGHLCRCGSYQGIFDAIQTACAGDFDPNEPVYYPRREALEKVTGTAKYSTDVHYDNMLEGHLICSPYASAIVKSIDTSKAKSVNAVEAIVDILDDPFRKVRYFGQPVLAIAVNDESALEGVMSLIEIDYEVLESLTSPQKALEPGAPLVYPEKKKSPPNSFEGMELPGKWMGNLRKLCVHWLFSHYPWKARKLIRKASSDPGLELVSSEFNTSGQIHSPFEPHACVANWIENEELTVHVSTQNVYTLALAIAKKFDIDRKQVNVISEYIGGAFGSKQELSAECIAAIELSKKSKRPVRITMNRRHEMTIGGYRPATKVKMDLAGTKNGEIKALSVQAYGDAGVAVQSMVTTQMVFTYKGIYKDLTDSDILTNMPPGKPFRGPYGPPAFWSLEQSMDQLACNLNMDPLEAHRKWDHNPLRVPLYDWIGSIPEWQSKTDHSEKKGRFRKGIGIALGNWMVMYYRCAKVELNASVYGFLAKSATQDMGNGSRSMIAKAIADELGISSLDVHVQVGHSEDVQGVGSSASRTTNALYYPAQQVGKKMKERLVKYARDKLGYQNAHYEKGGISYNGGYIPWSELLKRIEPISVTCTRGRNGFFDLMAFMPTGVEDMSITDKSTGCVYMTEIEVDTFLGKIQVLKVWAGLAAGKIVFPSLARNQVYGGIIQGIGYSLFEEREIDNKTGAILSSNLEDYHIPGIAEVPEMEIYFHEGGFKSQKGGAAGMSEISTISVAASIGNAFYNASGKRAYDLPLIPERVLKVLQT